MAEATQQTPVRLMWRMKAPGGARGAVSWQWLKSRLKSLDGSEGMLPDGAGRSLPLYPAALHDQLGRRHRVFGRLAVPYLSSLSLAATKVISSREVLDDLVGLLRSDDGVERDSVSSILDVAGAGSHAPSPAGTYDKMEQPYLEGRDKGGICLDRTDDSLRGNGVTLAVVEMGWTEHQDLPPDVIREMTLPVLTTLSPPGDHEKRHGNQVLGVLCAQRNQQGIDGVVDLARRVYVARFGADGTTTDPSDTHVFTALLTSILRLPPGSVVVAAVDARTASYTNRLPLEAWEEARLLFHLAALRSIYVVTAAGNGLGVPIDAFCRGRLAPSPAIVVGAAAHDACEPAWMSNVGCRVDLHSWGAGVATCDGMGTSEYTTHFSGTSAATAIVAAAVAALSSRLHHLGCATLPFGLPSPVELKHLLVTTGYRPIRDLGCRPDVTEAVKTLAFRRGCPRLPGGCLTTLLGWRRPGG